MSLAAALARRIERQQAKPKTPNPLRANTARAMAETYGRATPNPKESPRG
ncbi:hypothetical protein NGM36_26230 [Streptomyces mutabilis]|nr:hypothetical protein [Streptomyces mutabilis]MCZ9353222.1 hypothetical protein [Streptomyces mutabilis]